MPLFNKTNQRYRAVITDNDSMHRLPPVIHLGQSQFQSVLNALPDATIIINRKGEIVFASIAVESTYGFKPAELIGMPVETLIPESLRQRHVNHRKIYFEKPSFRLPGKGMELFGLRKDGSVFSAEISLSYLETDEGVLVICTIRDLSDRKITEQLLINDERFQLLMQNAPAAIAMFDSEMRYMVVSRRWLDDFRIADREVIGKVLFDMFPNSPIRWRQVYQQCLAGATFMETQDGFTTLDGQQEWLSWEMCPWHSNDGNIGGLILFTEVVTRRKEAEDALKASHERLEREVRERTHDLELAMSQTERDNKFKTRFLAAASHDLRQPLQSLGLYLTMLEELSNTSEQQGMCEAMEQSLETMGNLLNALLDISKYQSGTFIPIKKDFPLDPVLDRIISDNLHQSKAKGLKLASRNSQCTVHSDPALLERILENLVTNAIRYTQEGHVTISCECSNEHAALSVSDTGIGIPKEEQENIFDEYYQLANPGRDRRKGLGLGLAIVKHIAQILDHPLSLSSEPGKGSTFTVTVPLGAIQRKPAGEASESIEANGFNGRLELMLIEDDPMILKALGLFFDNAGMKVYKADSGEDAIRQIQSGLRPDIIISDYRLPGCTGIETVSRIRELVFDTVPAIIISGDTSIQQLQDGTLPKTTLFVKPVDPHKLMATISRITVIG